MATVNRLYILSVAFISCVDLRDLAFTQVKNIWLGCCAQGSFMAAWRLPEAPFTSIWPIPLSCALRNSAFGLQVRVISRQYTKIVQLLTTKKWSNCSFFDKSMKSCQIANILVTNSFRYGASPD